MENYKRSFVNGRDNTEFEYTAPYDLTGPIPSDPLRHRIPTGETNADGEYQADSSLEPRLFSFKGRIIAASPSELRGFLDTLFTAHPVGVAGKVYRRIIDNDGVTVLSSRYINCRVAYRDRGEEVGLPVGEWEIGFRAADPLYYDEGEQATPLAVGANAITPGGSETCLPHFTITTTGVGTVTLTESINGRSITLNADVIGTYGIDCLRRRVTVDTGGGAVSALSKVTSGGFFPLVPGAQSITLSGTALLGANKVVSWRRRWASS